MGQAAVATCAVRGQGGRDWGREGGCGLRAQEVGRDVGVRGLEWSALGDGAVSEALGCSFHHDFLSKLAFPGDTSGKEPTCHCR